MKHSFVPKEASSYLQLRGLQPDLLNQGGFWLKWEGLVAESENIATLRIQDAAASSRGVLRVATEEDLKIDSVGRRSGKDGIGKP